MRQVKFVTRVLAICAMMALFAVGTAVGAAYKVPKPKGGTVTTKTPAKAGGKTLESRTGATLAKGFGIPVKFPRAGTFTGKVIGGGKLIGSGSVTSTKAATKSLRITFTAAGQTFLKTSAGKRVKLVITFKPTTGKSVTSTTTVKLG